jgi:hypothetical protein
MLTHRGNTASGVRSRRQRPLRLQSPGKLRLKSTWFGFKWLHRATAIKERWKLRTIRQQTAC